MFSGDLALQAKNLYGAQEGEEEQRVPQVSPPQSLEFGSGSDTERILGLDSASVDSNMSPKQVTEVVSYKIIVRDILRRFFQYHDELRILFSFVTLPHPAKPLDVPVPLLGLKFINDGVDES